MQKIIQGIVRVVHEKGRRSVTRNIRGRSLKGEARIEHALGSDKADELRVRYVQGGKGYETACLGRSDRDNLPRLSGYLYRTGEETDTPGMEDLFRDHAHE